jgi:hypothetical protein
LRTASDLNVKNVQTPDLLIGEVGYVDVYTPKVDTSIASILRTIERKDSQTTSVLVQTDRPRSDLESIANRTWGKKDLDIRTLFFQNTEGTLLRIDRPKR